MTTLQGLHMVAAPNCIRAQHISIVSFKYDREKLHIFFAEHQNRFKDSRLGERSLAFLLQQLCFRGMHFSLDTLNVPSVKLFMCRTYQSLLSQLAQPSSFVSGLPSQTYIYGPLKLPSVLLLSSNPPLSSSWPIL